MLYRGWVQAHAVVMLLAAFTSLGLAAMLPVVVAAPLSLAWLVVLVDTKRPGRADAVTFVRLSLLIFVMLIEQPMPVTATCLAAFLVLKVSTVGWHVVITRPVRAVPCSTWKPMQLRFLLSEFDCTCLRGGDSWSCCPECYATRL